MHYVVIFTAEVSRFSAKYRVVSSRTSLRNSMRVSMVGNAMNA